MLFPVRGGLALHSGQDAELCSACSSTMPYLLLKSSTNADKQQLVDVALNSLYISGCGYGRAPLCRLHTADTLLCGCTSMTNTPNTCSPIPLIQLPRLLRATTCFFFCLAARATKQAVRVSLVCLQGQRYWGHAAAAHGVRLPS
jgi:hypothetical protein